MIFKYNLDEQGSLQSVLFVNLVLFYVYGHLCRKETIQSSLLYCVGNKTKDNTDLLLSPY